MSCPEPCYLFHFSVEDGTKAFCIAEMMIDLFHFIIAICEVSNIYIFGVVETKGLRIEPVNNREVTTLEITVVFFGVIFALSLVFQGIFGFLLFFLGWRNKNVTVCWIWITLASVNFCCPWVLYGLSYPADQNPPRHVRACFFYLFYEVYGIWIVRSYIKHSFASGHATSWFVTRRGDDEEDGRSRRFHHSTGADSRHSHGAMSSKSTPKAAAIAQKTGGGAVNKVSSNASTSSKAGSKKLVK